MPNKRETTNFSDPDSPRFVAAHAGEPPEFNGELKVISWNIQFTIEVETAMAEGRELEEREDLDGAFGSYRRASQGAID